MTTWTKACLTALRIAVGWHFLYEGLYKLDSDSGATSYATARYALQTATARLQARFASMSGAPAGAAESLAAIDDWHDSIVKSFAAQKALAEDQKARLAGLRDDTKLRALRAARGELAPEEVVAFDWPYVHAEVLRVPPPVEAERFTAVGYLQSSAGPFRGLFRGLLPDASGLERLTAASAQRALDAREREIVGHYASAGQPLDDAQKRRLTEVTRQLKASAAAVVSSPAFATRLADYRAMVRRVSEQSAAATTPFAKERLAADRKNLDLIATEMLNVIHEPLDELALQTQQIVTVRQMSAGPLPRPGAERVWVDRVVPVALTSIGAALLLGLFTPWAAWAAAGQLAMFYFASPPWPGLPATSLGGHYWMVDRNLIELLAALALAACGAGNWWSLDSWWKSFTTRSKS